MGLLDRVSEAQGRGTERSSIDQWITDYLLPVNQFSYNNAVYPFGLNQTLAGNRAQEIVTSLPGYASALKRCPPAFAAQMVRALVLSQARFVFRNPTYPTVRNGRRTTPRQTFGNRDLGILEKPWRNATTGELLSRMEWHAGLAGNAYVTNRQPGRLRVLRPDWVTIVFGSQQEPDDAAHALDGEIVGYAYVNGGLNSGNRVYTLLPEEVAHWSPLPDPEKAGVGMSWITPAVREIQGDGAATDHKLRYFENGAPQPLDARILTPDGWSTMGAMRVGSQVIGSDGKSHTILAVYPQGRKDVYRVSFNDGTSAECTLDHLWSVSNSYDRRRGVSRIMSLRELIVDGFHYRSGPAKWAVPMVDPVEYADDITLPLDPYLMGLLLGDGSFRSNGHGSGGVTLACNIHDTDETIDTIAPMLPAGVEISRRDRQQGWSELYFRGSRRVARGNTVTEIIKDLGLFDVIGRDKFIPSQFLRASIKERVALLQGLIDSDGSIEPTSVRFTTTSNRLASGLVELVGSLGGTATVHPAAKNRSTMTVLVRQLPEWINPARLSRKADKYTPSCALRVRTMVSAEMVRRCRVQCISVDVDDNLYVTDDFILTHNTPNLIVKGLQATDQDRFNELVDMMEGRHAGLRNAYKTLYLTEGADATVIGNNFQQMDFKNVQGAGETRLAFMSRVPAPILGISEGLSGSSLNAGNFGMSRRIFADSWIYPTLQDVCMALAPLVNVPADAELWFDTTDIPLLREDAKDAAEITQIQAVTISALVTQGFTPESCIAAVMAQNMTLLVHTGLVSVQLQPPGVMAGGEPGHGAPPPPHIPPRPIVRPPKPDGGSA